MASNILGNTSLTTFDVIVIGSGAGGGTAAYVLTQAGLKVLVLEAGMNRFDGLDDASALPTPRFSNDELKMGYRHFITPDPIVEPRTFRTSPSDGDRTYIGDVQSLAKDRRWRGRARRLEDAALHGAGLHTGNGFAEHLRRQLRRLASDLRQARAVLCIWREGPRRAGPRGREPLREPAQRPLSMPPGVPMYVSELAAKGLGSLGYTAFPYPMAVNSRVYDGRPACVDCGYCSGYGCPNNAKGSPAVTFLRKALLSGNCTLVTQTRAIALTTNGSGNTITGVSCLDPQGQPITYTADRYVLACSPIEDVRLLLLSDKGGPGLGNSSGVVGRNLMFHLQTTAVGIFAQRVHGHRGKTVSTGFADFRGVPNDPNHPLGGIVELSGSEFLLDEANYYRQIFGVFGFDAQLLKNLMRQSPGRDRVLAIAMQAEDAPQLTNQVDLDPAIVDIDGLPVARITYANSQFELSASAFYGPKILDFLGASGAKYAALGPASMPGSAHIMGTLRMGPDPMTSVCDPTGRFHDIGNLYCADGALFPTSSGFNPTMTIVALSLWVAGGMVSPGNPEAVLWQ